MWKFGGVRDEGRQDSRGTAVANVINSTISRAAGSPTQKKTGF